MKGLRKALIPALVVLGLAASSAEALPYRHHWECVPFAREMSGIQIYGNAHTWWSQAAGKYARGRQPKVGAVLSFRPHGSMRLGHVAMVSQIVDDRTVKLTHANWSLINGRRGQIERNVTAVDVSEAGDWSRVKVWFAPLRDIGKTSWPTNGFIYPENGGINDAKPGLSDLPPVRMAFADKAGLTKITPIKFAEAKPTGRLDDLGKLLKKLKEREED
jgi:surface antigen